MSIARSIRVLVLFTRLFGRAMSVPCRRFLVSATTTADAAAAIERSRTVRAAAVGFARREFELIYI